jgi:hypothetical protein
MEQLLQSPKQKIIPACGWSETAKSHDNIDAVWNFASYSNKVLLSYYVILTFTYLLFLHMDGRWT